MPVADAVKADCMIGMEDKDLVAMFKGKMNPQAAFMNGRIKLKGNMMLAMKLGELIKPVAAL